MRRCLPKAQHFILHTHAGEGVERAEWFVEQKNFGMINQGARQSYALCHAARKMMRISVGEGFQADEAHEFIDLTAFLLKHTARNQARFNITTHRQPRKKIGILKDKASFGAGACDWFLVYQQLTRIGKIETGDETQQSRFSATARSDERHELAGGKGD